MRISSYIFSLPFRLLLFALLATFPALLWTVNITVSERRHDIENVQHSALQVARNLAHEQRHLIKEADGLMAVLIRLLQLELLQFNPDRPQACQEVLEDLLTNSVYYGSLTVATLDGQVTCSVPVSSVPVDLASLTHFQQAIESRAVAIGNYRFNHITGKPVLPLAIPLLLESGEIQGVVIASLNLSWLEQEFDQMQLPEGTTATVFDQTGTVLARYPDPHQWVGRTLPDAALVQTVLAAQEAEGTTQQVSGLDGIMRLYAYVPLLEQEFPSSATYLSVGIPSAVAFARSNQLWVRNLIGFGVLIILLLLAARYGGEFLVLRRVRTLVQTTRRLAQGDLGARTGISSGSDELGELAKAIDYMAASLQRSGGRREGMLRVAIRLSAQLELDPILQTVCEEAVRTFAVPAASLSLYDPKHDHFYHRAAVGVPVDYSLRVQPVAKGEQVLPVHPTGTSDLPLRPDDPTDPNVLLHAEFGMYTVAGIDLVHGEQLLGRLNLYTYHTPRHLTQEELPVLQTLAHQAAQAIRNARLYTEARQRLNRLQALSTIDRAILTMQEMTATIQVVAGQVADQLGVDAVNVMLLDQEQQILTHIASTGFRGSKMHHTTLRLGEGYGGKAALERQIQSVPDLNKIDNFQRAPLLEGEDFVSYYSVPLLVQNEVIGVLELFQRTPLAPDPEWLSFLDGLALQTALAIHHTQLFTRTRSLLQQTQEQAKQLQQIMETVPEGVLFLDSTYHLQLANQAARAHLALLAPEVNGEPLTHLGKSPISQLVDTETVESGWQEIQAHDGQYLFEVAAGMMQTGGHLQGWVLVLRDVTVERQRQHVLQTQERLATVGQLAAGIAHDFNNILTPILLYTELTINSLPRESQAYANLDQVLIATKRARDLVFQILAFSRQESEQPRQRLQLQAILQEVLKLLHAALPATIEIRQNIYPQADVVLANPSQIHQVIMNLFTNAKHALGEKGGVLSVSLDTVQADEAFVATRPHLTVGPYVRLTISDTGYGIEPSLLPRIFDPFFTTKAPGEGTGLGLAVVYGIVMDHGGDITVQSQLGEGTVFRVYLPAADNDMAVEVSSSPLTQQGTERILLVDDEEMIVQVASQILTDLGYTVTGKTDSTESLALFQAHPDQFDLLITDLTMSKMTGAELIKEVLRIRPDFPILLMSGSSELLSPTLAESLGISITVLKPFSASDLSRTVRHLLET
jgi:signal transduction histidine kinase/CheY-like chemotaxis protein/HAMP domain-containing protein/putative methionine-R-sulfoxide reductase with GAF domain